MAHLTQKILAVVNQKGGVGKTTICDIFSEYLPLKKGVRTGFGDLDMQCNYTDSKIGMDPDPDAIGGSVPPPHPDFEQNENVLERSSIADCFYGHAFLPYPTWIDEEVGKNGAYLDVFAGHPQKLDEINVAFSNKDDYITPEALNRLRQVLHGEDFGDLYKLIGLDLGPSRNPIFRSALRAATHIVIPFEPEKKSMQGINAMLQVIRQENYARTNDMEKLIIVGLLPNKVRNTKVHKQILSEVKEYHSDLLFPEDCWLSLLTAFPERDIKDARPTSIFELPDSSIAKQQALNMCNYMYEKIFCKNADIKKDEHGITEEIGEV